MRLLIPLPLGIIGGAFYAQRTGIWIIVLNRQAVLAAGGTKGKQPVFLRILLCLLQPFPIPVRGPEEGDSAFGFQFVEDLYDGTDRYGGVIPV